MGILHRHNIWSVAGGFLVLFAVFSNITSLQAEEPLAETFGLESERLYTSSNLRYISPRPTDNPQKQKRWKKAWIASWIAFAAVNLLDAHSSVGKRELNPLLSNSQGRFSARKAALIKSAVGGGFFAVQWWMARKNRDGDYYRTFTIANSAMTAGLGTVAVHNYGVPKAEADLTSTTGQYLQQLPH